MVSREALETIKNIELHHMEVESDYDYEENLELSYYEEDDGTVEYNYFEEIKTIEKDLEVLKEYKQIEEELGIDLVVLIKALQNGFYTKKGYSSVEKTQICFGNFPTFIYSDCDNDGYLLTDYGKTWALTKEELQND